MTTVSQSVFSEAKAAPKFMAQRWLAACWEESSMDESHQETMAEMPKMAAEMSAIFGISPLCHFVTSSNTVQISTVFAPDGQRKQVVETITTYRIFVGIDERTPIDLSLCPYKEIVEVLTGEQAYWGMRNAHAKNVYLGHEAAMQGSLDSAGDDGNG